MGRKASSLGRTQRLVEEGAVRPLLVVTDRPQKSSDLERCVRTGLCWGLPPPASGAGAELAWHQNSQVGGSALHPLVHNCASLTALHLGEHSQCFSLDFCKLLSNRVAAASSRHRGWLGRCSRRAAFAAAGGSRAGLPTAVGLSVWINSKEIQAV